MATHTRGILGQVEPSATTATTLYTVPAGTSTIVSCLTVCNLNAAADTFRVAFRKDGDSLANKHYQAYDVSIAGNSALDICSGKTLGATDVVTVYSANGTTVFSIFGQETVP